MNPQKMLLITSWQSLVDLLRDTTDLWSWTSVSLAYALLMLTIALVVQTIFRQLAKRHLASQLTVAAQRLFMPSLVFLYCAPLVIFLEDFEIPRATRVVIDGVAKVGTIAAMVIFLIRLLNLAAAIYYRQLHLEQPDNLRARRMQTQVKFLEQLADVFIIFVGIATVLFSFERFRNFGGSLLASAGLASVIIGFAAQKSIGNLIAGFQIAFTQPIRLGDAVLVENEWGWIEEITLTYVVVQIWDLRRLILPINYFLEKPFQNWTRTSAALTGQVLLSVDFTVPLDELREELRRVVESTDLWDRQTVSLQVVDASDRCMNLRILVSARNSSQAWDLRCLVRERLLVYLQKHHPTSLPRMRIEKLDLLQQQLVDRDASSKVGSRPTNMDSSRPPAIV